jgi:hypothetical protein
MKTKLILFVGALLAIVSIARHTVIACPFCSVESQTLSEEIKGADAVVLAQLVKEAPANANPADPNSGMATFKIIEPLKGKESLGKTAEISVVFFGDSDRNKTYMVTGLGKDKIDWTTPLPLTSAAVEYVKKLQSVAPAGPERLVFFQDYLENADPLLAQDSYDEFGRAPYSELLALKPKMQHDRIVKWVADPEVSPSRRRLYLTMLGVCGTKADVPLLEGMIVSDFDAMKPALVGLVGTGIAMGGPVGMPAIIETVQQDERRKKLGLDALVACYLILRGPDGLDLVEDRFLKNPHAEYTHVYSTIMALRFHGDENTGIVPRERLLSSMRILLDNPDFADQVVLDLSRWEDWSVLERLVEMFKKSDTKGYIRQPVVSYLTVASEQPGDVGARAKAGLAELEKLDPETVKTARSLMAFGALGRARGAASAASATAKANTSATTPAPEPSTTSTVDSANAFSASAADENTDTSHIPDPATFNQEPQVKTAAAKPQSSTTPGMTPAVANASGTSVTKPQSELHKLNPLLVAGLPLAAAVALMGIYWLILRAGAV